MFSSEFLSLKDLYLAYRKAKADAFFESTHFHAIAYARYEQNLHRNLQRLLSAIRDDKGSAFTLSKFVGEYAYAPKSLGEFSDDGVHSRAVDPIADWEQRFTKSNEERVQAEFRLVMLPSIDFQVFSALWILKVGYRFDARLDRDCSYGNRLRSIRAFASNIDPDLVAVNEECLGLFIPYFSAYRTWRETGLKRMREALEHGHEIVAVTMDVRRFYHCVSPKFILRKEFLKAMNLNLADEQRELTSRLLQGIETWYRSTPDHAKRPKGALPVGLSASKIIANVLLFEFDNAVLAKLKPIYYGRYVDDIFLVVNRDKKVFSGTEVMQWLASGIKGVLKFEREGRNQADAILRVILPYAEDSDVVFAGKKQKIFHLNGAHGLDLVEQISEQIRRLSSEYRLLEELPSTTVEMAARALLATPDATLEADALRKADSVSVRRLGFALLLRDVEAYTRDLRPAVWVGLRREFYGLVHRHLLAPRGFFEFFAYLHRVFGIMVACQDFDEATRFLKAFQRVLDLVRSTTTGGTANKKLFSHCVHYYVRGLVQAAMQAATMNREMKFRSLSELLKKLRSIDGSVYVPTGAIGARVLSMQLLNSDLGRRPYKDYWYYSHTEDAKGPAVPKSLAIRRILRLGAIRNFREEANLRVPYWPALVFPTRPLTVPEIVLISPGLLRDKVKLRVAVMALRGARVLGDGAAGYEMQKGAVARAVLFNVPQKVSPPSARVAITSVETSLAYWERALRGRPDRSLVRYRRIRSLVNRILAEPRKPNYVVFPECSLPRRWGLAIASKLAKSGISVLAGLEYYSRSRRLRNDCLISLTTSWPGYSSSFVVLQPKQAPAHAEGDAIHKAGRSLYQPIGIETIPPVYVHGRICLGVLLCSDLTNIQHRRRFQGNVDALFVLEWNQDLSTFSYLVEATAHDVHAYVVQVNNRLYGDSRVRTPYRLEHRRDLVRLKGGATDYYVMADIDYAALRNFQRKKTGRKDSEFKPVPIGFRMSPLRRSLK